MLQCPICQQSLSSRKALSCHLTRKHRSLGLSPLEKEELIIDCLYYRGDIDKTIEGYLKEEYPISKLPLSIGRYIELLGLKRSHSEEKKGKGYKNRMSLSLHQLSLLIQQLLN